MFFQSKKKGLWKRLWRLRVNQQLQQQQQQNSANMEQEEILQLDHQNSLLYSNCQRIETTNLQKQRQYHQQHRDTTQSSSSSSIISPLTFVKCCACTLSPSSSTSSLNSINYNGYNKNNCNNRYNILSGGGGDGLQNYDQQLFRSLVDKLKDGQLETLCQAVENGTNGGVCTVGGGNLAGNGSGELFLIQTDCVLIPRTAITILEPHVIACRLWKWPDIRFSEELKRLPACPNEKDPVYACCNPTHWSRLCRAETPPPPYCLFAMDRLKPEDRAPCEDLHRIGDTYHQYSINTDGEESSSTGWCQLAYWELAQRVGHLFPVENSSVNVFSEQPRVDGLCLTTLAQQRLTQTPDRVLKARQKIGLGITLNNESDGVWLYNRSTSPVFVHSPTLHDIDTRSLLVFRVPPGHCLRAFNPNKAAKESFAWPSLIAGAQTGPIDINSVRISFAKGWGPKYSRQEVTGCPCWLEVLLTQYR